MMEESTYPHLYALSYLLCGGSRAFGGLEFSGHSERDLLQMEMDLAGRSFGSIVAYVNQDPGDPVTPEMTKVHDFMYAAGYVDDANSGL